MEKYFYDEFCPKCKKNTLVINKSPYHHIELCADRDCGYKYEEYHEGYEEYLSKRYVQNILK